MKQNPLKEQPIPAGLEVGKPSPLISRTCEYCGAEFTCTRQQVKRGWGKFCSCKCRAKAQNAYLITYNKSDLCKERTSARNKDPAFREKVSQGLKKRKCRLGDNYHSKETKIKIGAATKSRWSDVKEKLLPTLIWNGQSLRKKDNFPYGHEWRATSKQAKELSKYCFRCLSQENLIVHHIIPARFGGQPTLDNVFVLCNRCHPTVDRQSIILNNKINNWEKTRELLKERMSLITFIAIAKTVKSKAVNP